MIYSKRGLPLDPLLLSFIIMLRLALLSLLLTYCPAASSRSFSDAVQLPLVQSTGQPRPLVIW